MPNFIERLAKIRMFTSLQITTFVTLLQYFLSDTNFFAQREIPVLAVKLRGGPLSRKLRPPEIPRPGPAPNKVCLTLLGAQTAYVYKMCSPSAVRARASTGTDAGDGPRRAVFRRNPPKWNTNFRIYGGALCGWTVARRGRNLFPFTSIGRSYENGASPPQFQLIDTCGRRHNCSLPITERT